MTSNSCFSYIIADDFDSSKSCDEFEEIQCEDALQFFRKFESPGKDFTIDDEEAS